MKSLRKGLIALVVVLHLAGASIATALDGAAITHQWNRTLIETIMEDGFGPPIAARIHAYANLAGYEAGYHASPEHRSLVGQLNDFTECARPTEGETYDWRVAVVAAFQRASAKLVYRIYKTDSLADAQFAMLAKEVPTDVFERSKAFGRSVGSSIYQYSRGDNYTRTQGLPDWEWPKCDSCWEPTPPNFAKPLSPYCGDVRTMVMSSFDQFPVQPHVNFSIEPGSDFWKAATEVMEITANLTPEQKEIALHWNDNPIATLYHGHFVFNTRQISPGGHWMNIAMHLLRDENRPMVECLEIYTTTAVALFDAFTACWAEKYRSSLIRPVTYINRYIDKDWEPLLQTPPFPEHAGGHSTITASAAEALTHFFGDRPFTDSTELEFGLTVRSYENLRAAAWEASISRIFGGIHYRRGCDAGNAHGTQIGQFIVSSLRFRND